MKSCNQCGTAFSGTAWTCPVCHRDPPVIDGIRSFLAEAEDSRTGYDTDYYAKLAALEQENFWFRSRNRLILLALERYFPEVGSFFEIGCGTGFVLAAVEKRFPRATLAGSDFYPSGLRYAARRVIKAELFLMDALRIPFAGELDVIGAFDVLEHVREDGDVLRQMHRALAPRGGIILTVPHHPFLWSSTDEQARHVRRYRRAELHAKVEAAGFTVIRMTAFVSLLLPLMAISRLLKRKVESEDAVIEELHRGAFVNVALERVLDLERLFIRAGVNFPVGGSLMLIAKKT